MGDDFDFCFINPKPMLMFMREVVEERIMKKKNSTVGNLLFSVEELVIH